MNYRPSDDDVPALRSLAPAPSVAPMSDVARDRVEHEVRSRIASTTSPRKHARRLKVGALVTVAAATAVVLPVLLPGDDGGARSGFSIAATPAAARVLDQAADAVLRERRLAPRDDQWVYVRSVWTVADPEPGDRSRTDREIWLSQQPVMKDGSSRYIEHGSRVPIWYTSDHSTVPAGIDRPTYAWLDSLPTEPERLKQRLRDDIEAAGWHGEVDDQVIFSKIGELIQEALLPTRVQAALYRVVTGLRGVRSTPDAVDAAGRHGVGIVYDDPDPSTNYVDTWIFDRNTRALLGTRGREVRAEASDVSPATSGGDASAILERAVVDHRWQRPAR